MRRLGLAGDEVPSSLEGFIERNFGTDRQLTLLRKWTPWAAQHADEPNRSEAIRRLVEIGLKAKK